MYSSAQTARLQSEVDSLPSFLVAGEIDTLANDFANVFRKAIDNRIDANLVESLSSACNGLVIVGQELHHEGGESNPAVHHGIYGYSKGSDGYTKFLRGYAGAYRAWDDIVYRDTSNWATDLIAGTKKLLKDVKNGALGLVGDAGSATGKALWGSLWPIFALIGGILVAIVLIALFTKGKISLR